MSPEAIDGKNYDGYLSDIWSLGCTFYSFYTLSLPFNRNSINELIKSIQEEQVELNFDDKNLKNLIQKILVKDPQKRLKLTEIKSHPFFN